ncbi:NifB/NifX family molybdenum-iron cluster-binding protein [Halorhodospira halophila]|uniref:NifB/NifX family molybdenum-iron cluster-binding protein n=1 Tax=Halorhodospira halophila TaxID=1053 RepID=UPI001FD56FFC|nr:NifB/NifX family molybdenum-iron cluster-binding protein [Halorhodospira halophila]
MTPHAGRTRRFLIYEAGSGGEPRLIDRLELPKDHTLHHWGNAPGHPIYAYDVVIAASMGPNFVARMERHGVEAVATSVTDPEEAVRRYFRGTLPTLPPEQQIHGHS